MFIYVNLTQFEKHAMVMYNIDCMNNHARAFCRYICCVPVRYVAVFVSFRLKSRSRDSALADGGDAMTQASAATQRYVAVSLLLA